MVFATQGAKSVARKHFCNALVLCTPPNIYSNTVGHIHMACCETCWMVSRAGMGIVQTDVKSTGCCKDKAGVSPHNYVVN